MTTEHRDAARQASPTDQPTTAQMLDELTRFDGPPEQFLLRLLVFQCRTGNAAAGAVLHVGAQGQADVLAVHPRPTGQATPPVWLAQAAELAPRVASADRTTVSPLHTPDDLYDQAARRHLVLIPLRGGARFQGVGAFVVESPEPAAVASARERLELTSGLLSLYEMRLAAQRRGADLGRLRAAVEVLAAVDAQDRFMAAAMALCNEVAARWRCDRASLGFLKGRYVQLRAMSHTEKFSRKMQIVQDTEAAAEECLDQDTEVVHPADTESTAITRAAAELSRRHGPNAVASLPLRAKGEAQAVLVLERPIDAPFTPDEIEALRLVCELCTARLLGLHEHDRWFGARAASAARRGLAAAVGPKHTWKKLVAVLVLAAIIFLAFARGDYTASATFAFQAAQRRVVSAPFDGDLEEVCALPGADVEEEQVLARLKTAELKLKLARAKARRNAHLKESDAAAEKDDRAAAQIARLKAREAEADIRLMQYKIDQAALTAPIGGTVISEDLTPLIRTRFKTGQPLFEIAPVADVRAELAIAEDEIADVMTRFKKRSKDRELTGKLATHSKPHRRLRFVVTRVSPVAEVVDRANVFKARAKLRDVASGLAPGMTGVAKIHLGRRRYAWLWTRRLVNWLRMRLWL